MRQGCEGVSREEVEEQGGFAAVSILIRGRLGLSQRRQT
jgi:hypothetical protein